MMPRKRGRKRKSKNTDTILNNLYFKAKNPASFGGRQRLIAAAKAKKIAGSKVVKFLEGKETYSLHKPLRRNFPRRKTVVAGIDSLWQCDLADVQSLANDNSGTRYILLCVDALSRFGFARGLPNKGGVSVRDAMDSILTTSGRVPRQCQTDSGKEFLNAHVRHLFKENNIEHYVTYNQEMKASLIERFVRTVKSKLWRFITHEGSQRYVDALPDIIEGYNNSTHNAIGLKPSEVNSANQEVVWQRVYQDDDEMIDSAEIRFKFELGDRVRLSKYSTTFAKGYLPSWTSEVFTVVDRHTTYPPVYSIADDSRQTLRGSFYEAELQKVDTSDNVYRIESILSTRKLNGRTQYLVRWAGWDATHDSYVDKRDLVNNYKN